MNEMLVRGVLEHLGAASDVLPPLQHVVHIGAQNRRWRNCPLLAENAPRAKSLESAHKKSHKEEE